MVPHSQARWNQFARVAHIGAEQRARNKKVPIEKFPLGPDFDRLGLDRTEDLVDRRVGKLQTAIVRRSAIEFGADRIGGRAVSGIDARSWQWLDQQSDVCNSPCWT